jgi:kinetochore protein Spc24, fungi type
MQRLDTEKFRIAKEASEAEREAERAEKEVAATRRALEEIDAVEGSGGLQGPMEGGRAAGADETVLKLKVYRMLGIDVEPDPETGLYTKAVVRNREKGDVRVVNIDPKFSRYFYADYFWKTL